MKLRTLALAATLAMTALAVAPARATDAGTCGYNQGPGGWYKADDRSGPYSVDGNCTATLLGSGSAGISLRGSSTSANSNSHAVTGALAASLVVKASPGNLYSVNATGITGVTAAGYLVVINATAAPANGAITPLDFCYFNGAGGCSLSHGTIPVNYSTGIVALITTAASPYTYTSGVDTAAISGDFQ